jgi:hypothetical protein
MPCGSMCVILAAPGFHFDDFRRWIARVAGVKAESMMTGSSIS